MPPEKSTPPGVFFRFTCTPVKGLLWPGGKYGKMVLYNREKGRQTQ